VKTTKNQNTMAFLTLEDMSGSIEVIVFPQMLAKFNAALAEGNAVVAEGKLSAGGEEEPKLLLDFACPAGEYRGHGAGEKRTGKEGLYLKVPSQNSREYQKAMNLISIFDGNFPVIFYFTDTGKYVKLPQNLYVFHNNPMIRELKNILGDDNVVTRH